MTSLISVPSESMPYGFASQPGDAQKHCAERCKMYWQLWDDSGLLKTAYREVIRNLWQAELDLDPSLSDQLYAENPETGEVVEELAKF